MHQAPSRCFSHCIAVFFVGGEDDRETLALAAYMSQHPGQPFELSQEGKLDNKALMSFKTRNVGNDRVVYKELVVSGTEEIKSEIKPIALERLGEWVDCPELGLIGDMLASRGFITTASVLVIRQQIHVNLSIPQHPSQNSTRLANPIKRYGILNFTREDAAEGRIRQAVAATRPPCVFLYRHQSRILGDTSIVAPPVVHTQ